MFDLTGGSLPEDVEVSPVGASRQFIENYTQDIQAYLKWKATDVSDVPADHWMVSMLTTLAQKVGYDLSRTVEDIYRRAGYLANEIAMTFGFTSQSNAGRIHIGDSGNKTVYLIGESPFRRGVTRSTPYWDMNPIRFLSHDSTNLTLGNNAESEDLIGLGLDVIEIDLGLLMLQYTLWMREQLASEEKYKRTPQMYVAMHVLPRLKFSQYAIAIMNRCCAIAEGLPVNNVPVRLSKSYIDRTASGQKIFETFTKIMLSKQTTFEKLIGTLPVPLVGTLGRATSVGQYAPTAQVTWALVLGRYNLLRYLWALGRVEPNHSKMYPINDIRRIIGRVLGANGMSAALDRRTFQDVAMKLDALLSQAMA